MQSKHVGLTGGQGVDTVPSTHSYSRIDIQETNTIPQGMLFHSDMSVVLHIYLNYFFLSIRQRILYLLRVNSLPLN